jgi:hypothetical protein
MQASIDTACWQFSSRWMIREYYDLILREDETRPENCNVFQVKSYWRDCRACDDSGGTGQSLAGG